MVDDDSMNRDYVKKILSRQNVEYFEAKNGKEATEIYEENWKEIGLIFMDC